MMQPRRSRNKVVSEILEACKGDGAAKTKIVYQANLNFVTANPYLASLVEGGLLEVIDGPLKLYRTTEKGNGLLERLREIDAQITNALSD